MAEKIPHAEHNRQQAAKEVDNHKMAQIKAAAEVARRRAGK